MEIEEFKEVIEEFVANNFCADGCMECSEVGHGIVPDDYRGSYDKAILELTNKLKVSENLMDLIK